MMKNNHKLFCRCLIGLLTAGIVLTASSCGVVKKLDGESQASSGSQSSEISQTEEMESQLSTESQLSSDLTSETSSLVSEPMVSEPATPITEDQFATVFQDSVVVGDSITEGVAAYQVLPEANVVYERGANMENSDDLIQAAIAKAPSNVFLSFGINDLVIYGSNSEPYIKAYEEAIQTLKSSLPDAKIYVNSIVPMADNAIAKQSSLQYYSQYNEELKSMCSRLKVTYVDNTDILTQQPELHEPDGIHVSRQYYILWMQRLAQTAKLA